MTDWTLRAACADHDPDMWFPEPCGAYAEAKSICQGCPVKVECLAFAFDNYEQHGIFGGLGPRERAALRRETAA